MKNLKRPIVVKRVPDGSIFLLGLSLTSLVACVPDELDLNWSCFRSERTKTSFHYFLQDAWPRSLSFKFNTQAADSMAMPVNVSVARPHTLARLALRSPAIVTTKAPALGLVIHKISFALLCSSNIRARACSLLQMPEQQLVS